MSPCRHRWRWTCGCGSCAVDRGSSMRDAARRFAVSLSAAKLMQRVRDRQRRS
jgi:hypothetical protein